MRLSLCYPKSYGDVVSKTNVSLYTVFSEKSFSISLSGIENGLYTRIQKSKYIYTFGLSDLFVYVLFVYNVYFWLLFNQVVVVQLVRSVYICKCLLYIQLQAPVSVSHYFIYN